jgi:hypothetical protein
MRRTLLTAALIAAAFIPPAQASGAARLGVFANETGGIAAFDAAAGTPAAIDHTYVPWTFKDWQKRVAPDFTAGRIPLLSWSAAPTTTAAAIASGSQDAVLNAAAVALKASGKLVYLRPYYEFDQPVGHPRHIGTPAEVIAAWRHTYTVFHAQGATNVKLVWCPMSFDFANGVAQTYWPGAAYVDVVAADGYNFPGRKWRSVGTIFASAYAYAVSQGRPFMVAETASPGADSRTPAYIEGMAAWAAQNPDTTAVVYFDSVSPKGYDFRLIAHPAAMAAYLWDLGQPAFGG